MIRSDLVDGNIDRRLVGKGSEGDVKLPDEKTKCHLLSIPYPNCLSPAFLGEGHGPRTAQERRGFLLGTARSMFLAQLPSWLMGGDLGKREWLHVCNPLTKTNSGLVPDLVPRHSSLPYPIKVVYSIRKLPRPI